MLIWKSRSLPWLSRRDGLALLLTFAALGWAGCGKDHALDTVTNPTDPNESGITPPVPIRVQGTLASRTVELSWALNDSAHVAEVARYRIYRTDETGVLALRDSSDAPPALVSGLDNGTLYRFRVTAVLRSGLEGNPSNAITASPSSFGVVIEGGRQVTNSQIVLVSLQAPAGTQGLRLSNLEDLSDASDQPFSTSRSWELPTGDGLRTVYVQFIDAQGNESRVVSDAILVDTEAEISAVGFSPSESTPGSTLHLRLDAGELEGTAQVRLGDGGALVRLRDDGREGDAVAGDGIYERDHLLEQTTELFQVLVTGFFSDAAGNQAESRVAPGRLTVHANPGPVTLSVPTSAGSRELTLRWTQAADPERFNAYRVFRDEQPGVATSVTRRQVQEQFSRTQTSFTDSGLDPTRTYYYIVEVVDRFGNAVASNEVFGRPRDNTAPDPVVLNPPSEISETAVTLTFSRSFADDFAAYRLYRGLQPDLDQDPERRLLGTVSNVSDTRFVDRTEIEENQVYYYRVDVVDDLAATSPSNVVSATIPDRLPTAIDLRQPSSVGQTTILLQWSRNSDRDFGRYELRRGTVAGVTESSPLIISVSDADVVSYLDTGLRENTEYFYRMFVIDGGGNRVGSGEIRVKTGNADPAPVTLAAPIEVSGSATPTVQLAWSASSAHDFERYRIFRDNAPSVSDASTLVRAIFEPNVTTFTEAGLRDNQRYYYRVFVEDDAGAATGSNEQSIVTANRAPTPVVLTVSATTPTSISLSWTQNTDADFSQYRLLQGVNDSSFPTVAGEFSRREQTSHTVFVPSGTTTVYFFKLVVFDQDIDSTQRLSSDSNVVSAQTSTE